MYHGSGPRAKASRTGQTGRKNFSNKENNNEKRKGNFANPPAFIRRHVEEHHPVADVAVRLGMKVAAVYKARSNVQKLLREEVKYLEGVDA